MLGIEGHHLFKRFWQLFHFGAAEDLIFPVTYTDVAEGDLVSSAIVVAVAAVQAVGVKNGDGAGRSCHFHDAILQFGIGAQVVVKA